MQFNRYSLFFTILFISIFQTLLAGKWLESRIRIVKGVQKKSWEKSFFQEPDEPASNIVADHDVMNDEVLHDVDSAIDVDVHKIKKPAKQQKRPALKRTLIKKKVLPIKRAKQNEVKVVKKPVDMDLSEGEGIDSGDELHDEFDVADKEAKKEVPDRESKIDRRKKSVKKEENGVKKEKGPVSKKRSFKGRLIEKQKSRKEQMKRLQRRKRVNNRRIQ